MRTSSNGGTGRSTPATSTPQNIFIAWPCAWALAISWSAWARDTGTFCASTK